ncbi:MAG: flagellar basal body L-ring protein FlgH [Rubrivivax sp.]|nr:flagellar basal body L-ring protein FlgH [Rubrivivax sp.]
MRAVHTAARALRLALAVAAGAGLGGCVSYLAPPRVEVGATEAPMPAPVLLPAPSNGAIYQAGQYRPLFEDHRARLVGDSLTVSIVEKVSATQSSKSTIDKGGSIDASVSALPGISSKAFARATASGTSSNTFEGKGATENTNDFSGTITVLVTGVLPNGHLLVAGEKQIGVNQNVDVLRFSGQVDPRNIGAANTVASTAIANVRLEHRGRGAQANANAIGWLSRVFLSVLPI